MGLRNNSHSEFVVRSGRRREVPVQHTRRRLELRRGGRPGVPEQRRLRVEIVQRSPGGGGAHPVSGASSLLLNFALPGDRYSVNYEIARIKP